MHVTRVTKTYTHVTRIYNYLYTNSLTCLIRF